MFKKVLIANRGEIAVRIIRACREIGIRAVAVYSTADRNSLHAQIADEAICIGPAATKDSYLNMNAIIQAALNVGADAIHPGFGFLSENAVFARRCEENGITFIGPSYKSIEMLGDKAAAKETMAAAGVPVIPGSKGAVSSLEEAKEVAAKAGYPVLVKASAGGGGRGIRRADSPEELESQMIIAQQEAKNFFGDDSVYIEKLLINPHHVEIQIIADKHKQRTVLWREIGRLFSELFDALVICNVVNDAGFFCKTVFFYKRFAYSLGYTNDFVKLLITAFFFFLIFINAYAPRIVDKIRVNIGNFYAVFIL